MGFAGMVGPLVSLIGGAAGGGKGGGGGGGVTAQEAALNQYKGQQQQLANMSLHANTGTGIGTGAVLGNVGAGMTTALGNAAASDANQAQQFAANQSALQNMAFQSGFGTSANQGSFGSTPSTTAT